MDGNVAPKTRHPYRKIFSYKLASASLANVMLTIRVNDSNLKGAWDQYSIKG